ncbi:MAG: T9SS type A sorting domain-containing protein [Ignavibacteria bacterium]|nr:T9SS type A sorting domain-containing protein [Ignavibacteria bacterium]
MRIYFSIILLLFTYSVLSQENVKVMTYNILEYSGSDSAVRNPHFRKVILNSSPDILIIEEIHSQQALNGFLANVMNAYGNFYSAGTFINGPDTDNGIFFRTSKFIFISNTRITTAFRDINEFKLIHINYPGDTLRIFAVHLYPGSGSVNENRRAAEVDSLRKFTSSLPSNSLYITAGDFNITGANEPAYIKLMQTGNGNFIDLLPPMPGIWDNPAYASYHTMSSRVRSFGGGSTGGLRNRFDMILVSPSISNNGRITYVPNTITAFGNDGNHYQDSINQRPNTIVPDSIADAIHYSSDHIPQFAIFKFGNPVGIQAHHNSYPHNFLLKQNYPNPFNPVTAINISIPKAGNIVLKVYDSKGDEAATILDKFVLAGDHTIHFDAAEFSSGVYFCTLRSGDFTATRKMILVK